MKKICEYCKKEFETENKRVKYCSKRCKTNAGNRAHRKRLCPPSGVYTCKNCGKEFDYVHGQDNYGSIGCKIRPYEFCCYECGVQKRSEKQKRSMTPEKIENMIKRSKKTKLEKYNDENYSNREKAKKTCFSKYGVCSASCLDSIKLKVKATKLQRYGNENYQNVEKIRQSYFEKTGYTNPSQNPEIKEKKALKKTYTLDTFVRKANKKHNNLYDYSKVNYKGCLIPITIICPKHGEFLQTPYTHLAGNGCQKCRKSKGEKSISDYLTLNNIKYFEQYKFDECRDKRRLPFDFYLPDYNICIEYQGKQHYEPTMHVMLAKNETVGYEAYLVQKRHDQIKKEFCKNSNIRLIEIKYDQKVSTILDECLKNK